MSRTIGLTAAAHSVYLEGAETFLDRLQLAGVNTAIVHTHGGGHFGRDARAFAPDHGVDYAKIPDLKFPELQYTPDAARYAQLAPLRLPTREGRAFGDRDIISELLPALRRRGMKMFSRIIEGDITGYDPAEAVRQHTLDGKRQGQACWANPLWRDWFRATGADLAARGLDGLHWGSERPGPLSATLLWRWEPACFCPHCLDRARKSGLSVERVRAGYQSLHRLSRALDAGERPAEGVFTAVLRHFFDYPEILGYDRLWHVAREECLAGLREAAREINPTFQVGWHVWQYTVSFDLFQRATCDYARMAATCDHLKPVVYHQVGGPRLADLADGWHRRTWLADLADEEPLRFLLRTTGLDPAHEGDAATLRARGLTPDYVRAETVRTLSAVANTSCQVLAGIGLDLIAGKGDTFRHLPSTTESVRGSIHAAAAAGAHGLILCREYDEMRLTSLKAAGEAIATAPWQN